MVNLWLHLPTLTCGDVAPPRACPRVGCDGRRFRLHQTIGKAIAPDGCCVAFRSSSRRLVAGKADDEPEIVVFDRRARRIDRFRPVVVDDAFSTPAELARGAMAAGGRIVALTTGRALVATDRNTVADVYALVTRGADARVWLPVVGRW